MRKKGRYKDCIRQLAESSGGKGQKPYLAGGQRIEAILRKKRKKNSQVVDRGKAIDLAGVSFEQT